MYKYLLFDLDGTLVDTSEGIINSAKYSLAKCGITENDSNRLKQFIGPPLKETFATVYSMENELAVYATNEFRNFYNKKGKYQCRLYTGISNMLLQLNKLKYTLIVATSKPTVFSIDILTHLEINHFFDSIVGSNLDNTRSKKAEIIDTILRKYKITNKSNTVMIGDKSQDLLGAEACGISGIAVSYGFGSVEELVSVQSEKIVHSPEELLEYLENS